MPVRHRSHVCHTNLDCSNNLFPQTVKHTGSRNTQFWMYFRTVCNGQRVAHALTFTRGFCFGVTVFFVTAALVGCEAAVELPVFFFLADAPPKNDRMSMLVSSEGQIVPPLQRQRLWVAQLCSYNVCYVRYNMRLSHTGGIEAHSDRRGMLRDTMRSLALCALANAEHQRFKSLHHVLQN